MPLTPKIFSPANTSPHHDHLIVNKTDHHEDSTVFWPSGIRCLPHARSSNSYRLEHLYNEFSRDEKHPSRCSTGLSLRSYSVALGTHLPQSSPGAKRKHEKIRYGNGKRAKALHAELLTEAEDRVDEASNRKPSECYNGQRIRESTAKLDRIVGDCRKYEVQPRTW